ncbi:MAG: hypothetical protein SVV03_04050 [Candidatus Nanohaloarchaea archaeon]|nr:hypothetical protein [Candidatus Nanohaloarchaea archaeon]
MMSKIPLRERERKGLPQELSRLSERGYDDKSYCSERFLVAFDALSKDSRIEIAEILIEMIFDYYKHPPQHPGMHWYEKLDCWQLEVKEDNTDHRIYIDWDKQTKPNPQILALFHADQTH